MWLLVSMFGGHWVLVLLYWEAKTAFVFHYAGPQSTDTIKAESADWLKKLGESDGWTIDNLSSSDGEPICAPRRRAVNAGFDWKGGPFLANSRMTSRGCFSLSQS